MYCSINIVSSLDALTATVNSVVLEEGSVTTTDLDVTLMGEFVQSGVNISVEVQARIEDTACDPVSGSIEISGGTCVCACMCVCMCVLVCVHVRACVYVCSSIQLTF